LWDFNIKYILGKKNSLTDGLSRQLLDKEWLNKPEEDIKEFINCELSALEYIAAPIEMETD